FLTHFTGSWSSCFAHHRATRLSLGSYWSFGARGSLLAGSFCLGFLLRFFFGLQTRRLLGSTLLFQFTLLVGLDFNRAALDEGLLLTDFDTDGLAAWSFQGRGGLALQGNLARLISLRTMITLQVAQQRLFFTIGHYLLSARVRQASLTHLQQQSLDRCVDHLGQFFHRDLRHAFLSSGRNCFTRTSGLGRP